MKAASTICPDAPALERSRALDYIELTKPRISVMVLLTVAAGAVLAGAAELDWRMLAHAIFGTAMVAAGASALNQLLERDSDARMRRTENRPLPAGRLLPVEVLVLGVVLGLFGTIYLAVTQRNLLAASIALFTFVSYAFVYTPLKRVTTLNTLIGAVPGALPPVIGWAAVRGSLDFEIATLFVILFLWQLPHFLAIAWIYRDDYARAGLQMLPVHDAMGTLTSRQMIVYCFALIPASLTPLLLGTGGVVYAVGAVLLGLGFLAAAILFARERSISRARGVLRASLLYLPLLLALLMLDARP